MAARTKADQCYKILKARIVDGTYGPGYRLVIDQLSREHDISANPSRESVRRLEAEGWSRSSHTRVPSCEHSTSTPSAARSSSPRASRAWPRHCRPSG